MIDNLLDLAIRYQGTMEPRNAAATGHIKHITLTQELFRARVSEDGAAVDLRGHLAANAGREVRLDGAGDHIARRPLRCHDYMDAGGPRHLRQTLDRAFDILAGDHH